MTIEEEREVLLKQYDELDELDDGSPETVAAMMTIEERLDEIGWTVKEAV